MGDFALIRHTKIFFKKKFILAFLLVFQCIASAQASVTVDRGAGVFESNGTPVFSNERVVDYPLYPGAVMCNTESEVYSNQASDQKTKSLTVYEFLSDLNAAAKNNATIDAVTSQFNKLSLAPNKIDQGSPDKPIIVDGDIYGIPMNPGPVYDMLPPHRPINFGVKSHSYPQAIHGSPSNLRCYSPYPRPSIVSTGDLIGDEIRIEQALDDVIRYAFGAMKASILERDFKCYIYESSTDLERITMCKIEYLKKLFVQGQEAATSVEMKGLYDKYWSIMEQTLVTPIHKTMCVFLNNSSYAVRSAKLSYLFNQGEFFSESLYNALSLPPQSDLILQSLYSNISSTRALLDQTDF